VGPRASLNTVVKEESLSQIVLGNLKCGQSIFPLQHMISTIPRHS
jgi:hypothetical protein